MDDSFDKLGEAIHLASQADLDAAKEDDGLKTFEELFRHLQLQQRLILEGSVQKRKIDHLKENQHINDPLELTEKLREASVKSEESMQIHIICKQAIEASQFSLALQSVKNDDPAAEKIEEELVESSIECLTLSLGNLSESQEIENLRSELHVVQEKLKQVQFDISELKNNPETKAGTKSERIEKLESQLDKFSGRYNFSRFLTQLLLLASEEDLNDPKISELFVNCGESLD